MTPAATQGLPTHEDLPDSDGSIVENFQENPQAALLAESLARHLLRLRPDGLFAIGTDSGIFWRPTDPPLKGCKAPDFFVVLGVPPMLNGAIRRSYVLWQERVAPTLVAEFVSGTGKEERDRTPDTGKFWVYEQGIKAPYYAIFDGFRGTLEVHRLAGGVYRPVEANADDRFPVPELGVELGLWRGVARQMDVTWLRMWDAATKALLPSDAEAEEAQRRRADAERRRAEEERRQREAAEGAVDHLREELTHEAEQARKARQEAGEERRKADDERRKADDERRKADQADQRAARLAERLRQLGIDPDAA